MKDIWSCWKYQVCSVEKEPHQSSKKMLVDSFPIQIESWRNAKVQGQCLVALSLSLSSLLSFHPSLASHGINLTSLHAEKFTFESEGWSFGGNGGCVFTFIISLPLQSWRNKKKLSGGMALQGNSWSCSCENVWLGRWLRRWMREVEQ